MLIQDVMSTSVQTCRSHESLNVAAQKMWEAEIGAVPVLDDKQRVVGMITDRDICMAAHMQGRLLSDLIVAESMSRSLVTCSPTDTIAHAEQLMREHGVRRLPVVVNRRVVGIVSVTDLARAVARSHRGQGELLETMAAVSEQRSGSRAGS